MRLTRLAFNLVSLCGGASACAASVLASGAKTGHFQLPERMVMAFDLQGHVATRGLLAPEPFAIAAHDLRLVADIEGAAAASRKASVMGASTRKEVSPLPFVQIHNPHKRHAAARRLALSPVLLATAATLLGVASVKLYQDSLFWKQPGNDATAWHADLWTVPISTKHFVTVWLPLHRVDVSDSPLLYQSGTHSDLGSELGDEGAVDLESVPAPHLPHADHHCPLETGDATWHHGLTVHGAAPMNKGTSDRLAYTAAYYSDDSPMDGEALEELAFRRRFRSSVDVDWIGVSGA